MRRRTGASRHAGPGRTGHRRTGKSSAGSNPSCANACTSTRWRARTSVNVHWTPSWNTTTTTDRTSASRASPPSPASLPCQQRCERQQLGRRRTAQASWPARISLHKKDNGDESARHHQKHTVMQKPQRSRTVIRGHTAHTRGSTPQKCVLQCDP
jgi:hypothetical protein